jgi:hypothetical protein
MRRNRGWVAIALAATIACAAHAPAQETRRTFASQGVWELGGTMSFSTLWNVSGGQASNTPVYTLDLNPVFGYFVIDGLEIGANPLGVSYVSQGGTSYTLLKLLGSVAYNYRTPARVYPYVEGLAGYSMLMATGDDAGGFTWAGRVGLKVSVGSSALVNVGVEYLQATLNLPSQTTRNGYNRLAVTAGFALWL